MDKSTILRKSASIVAKEVGCECVLVPVTNDIADMDSVYTMNETGSFIWSLIDGERSVETIIDALVDEFEIDRETAEKDLLSFIEEVARETGALEMV